MLYIFICYSYYVQSQIEEEKMGILKYSKSICFVREFCNLGSYMNWS